MMAEARLFDFSEFPILLTERLCLRQLVETDAESVMAIRGDYQVTRYNIGDAYTDIAQAVGLIDNIRRTFENESTLYWGITLRPANTVIGMIGYNYWNRIDHRGSVGFDLAREYWGRGIMPEALREILRFGFEQMGLNRVEADASVYNTQSQRTLQKVGFRQEGHLREQYHEADSYHDLLLFALLKRQFMELDHSAGGSTA
jgi:ribosomal-protein-alanine N-acetyltransferase